jgi:hypothetical protein
MVDGNLRSKHTPRRIILLSSVAGLALALLIAGPSGPHAVSTWSVAAQATESMSQPAPGFADLVAKVKPASSPFGLSSMSRRARSRMRTIKAAAEMAT